MGDAHRLLIVEDVETDAALVRLELERAGLACVLHRVDTEPEFRREIEDFRPQLIIADFRMPRFDGLSALAIARQIVPEVPFIFFSGTLGEENAVRALQNGATDYVLKDNLVRLAPAVRRALRDWQDRAAARAELAESRQRFEQVRRESEARLRTIFESAAVGMVHSDSDGRVLMANPKFAEITGYAREELAQLGLRELTHPADLPESLEFRAQLSAGAIGQYERETRLIRKDGQEVWTSITTSPAPVDEGKPSHFISIIRDISGRRRMEQELQRFRLAVDNSADMILIIDTETLLHVDVNETACRLLGYSREELLRMGPAQILPVARERLEKSYRELIANPGLPSGMNSYYLCKDGSRLPFESTRRVVRSGERWLVVAISRDIRQRIAAEQALRESEAGLRRAQVMAKLASVVTGPDGSFESWSETLPELIGMPADQVPRTTRDWLELVHPEDRALVRAKAIEGGVKRVRMKIKYRLRRADGAWISVRHTMDPLRTGRDAEIERWFTTIQDVTEQREAEERIERLNRVYAVLSGINSLIVRVSNRDELFREACRIAVEAGKFHFAWVGTVDRAAAQLVPSAWHGVEDGFLAAIAARLGLGDANAPGGSMVAQAANAAQAIFSNDVANDPRILFKPEHAERGVCSLAALPLIASGEVAAILTLNSTEPGFFDDEEVRLLDELASDISFALDHIEQQERVRHLTRVRAVLSGINALTVRVRDRDELLREACRVAVEAGEFKLAWIGLVERAARRLTPVAWHGGARDYIESMPLALDEAAGQRYGLGGRAVKEGRPMISDDMASDSRILLSAEARRRGFRSLAMLPLSVSGEVTGVLALYTEEVGFFDEEERKLLEELSRDLSLALEHLAKEEKVRRLTRVRTVLGEINAAIVRVRDRRQLFEEACRIAVEAGNFRFAWAAIVDEERKQLEPIAHAGADGGFLETIRSHLSFADGAPQGHGISALAVRERQAVIVNDVRNDPRLKFGRDQEERGVRSVAVLPLLVGGKAVAVFGLQSAVAGFFDEEEMRLLRELAGDIAFALDHLEKTARIDYLAYYDSLTGFANRSLFIERLRQKIRDAAGGKRRLAVWMIDIERFKTVNDAFGRQSGDQLLKEVAARMKQAGKDETRMARLGADHFALMSDDAQSESEVARLTERRFQEIFEAPFALAGHELRVAARFGIAIYPSDGEDAEALLRSAEAALKKAKAGGERYLFYAQDMTERTAEKLALESRLRQALESDEFVLHYQPKVDAETRELVGVEALIRWQSPELGLVPPVKFIPLLEETGLILDVGAWALKRAARDHRRWVESGLKAPRIAVNVSAIQLRQRNFVATLQRALAKGTPAPGVDLEITESLIMQDIEANIGKLKQVRALGVGLAIDDFGTGYSSLSYLAKLPIETLKIDRSFIVTMLQDSNPMTLVQTILTLAHSLRLKVVAEGVETEDQARVLRLLRCDQMQGFLFSKPLPAEELVKLLRNGIP